MINFPDLVHLEKLRKNLWRGGPHGKAAVMIGAGFSKNARKLRLSAPYFPSWKELTSSFLHTLYPNDELTREKLEALGSTSSGALRLAEEFEAAFGRPELDQMLIETIPDGDYAPDHLHKLLLQLPWSDILTTNYDTLLERASLEVISRKYEIIRTQEDTSRASRPRIVKLHGTFPDVRPFIVTEEDFRTYPSKFAGFVNLAQQVIIENSVCLIGFSGDDPNFLHWSGWVRDNLGKHAPQIYLCGMLNLTAAKRKLLHTRNVIPIDLSFAPGLKIPDHLTDEERHSYATEWLLLSLENARPFNLKYWLNRAPWTPTKPTRKEIEPLETPDKPPYSPHKHLAGDATIEVANETIEAWKYDRLNYPKWILAPHNVREKIWERTASVYWMILRFLPQQTIERRFECLYELLWRLELSLLPCWNEVQKNLEDVLFQIAGIDDPVSEYPTIPPQYTESWLDLALANLRYYREERRFRDHSTWKRLIELLIGDFPSHRQRFCHELCLEALYRADREELICCLDSWKTDDGDPIWVIRKASIVIEIGNVDEAERMLQTALLQIRNGIRNQLDDYANLSREGWCLRLLGSLNLSKSLTDSNCERVDNRERLEFLEQHLCNPASEIYDLENLIGQDPPKPEPDVQDTREFDPGHVTRTTSMIPRDVSLDAAYQYMRLSELGPIPTICGELSLGAHNLNSAAHWFMEYDPVRTISLLCRLSEPKIAEAYLSRHRVAALSQETISDLYRTFKLCLDQSAKEWSRMWQETHNPKQRSSLNRLTTSLEVLSRISTRLSKEERRLLWIFGVSFITSEPVRCHFTLPKLLHELLQRIFLSSDNQDLSERFFDLLRLPIPNANGFTVPHAQAWRDLWIEHVDQVIENKRELLPRDAKKIIDYLIECANAQDVTVRGFAISRLMILQDCQLINVKDLMKFGKAVWGQIDTQTKLPRIRNSVQSVRPSALLSLPEPRSGLAAKRLRLFLNEDDLPRYVTNEGGFQGLDDGDAFLKNWIGTTSSISSKKPKTKRDYIDWSYDELATLFEKLISWWQGEGKSDYWTKRQSHGLIDFKWYYERRIYWIIGTIRRVILPQLNKSDKLLNEILSLVKEWDTLAIPTDGLKPALLRFQPEQYQSVVSQIERSFISSSSWRIRSALDGLAHWIRIGRKIGRRNNKLAPPSSLVHRLGAIFELRLEPALQGATQIIESILEDSPEYVDTTLVESLNRGLNILLEATAYRLKAETVQGIKYEDVPTYRCQAARIAWLLSKVPGSASEVTDDWLEQARNDPLPEVRRAVGCE